MAAFISEAAKAIGVSPATLKRWFRSAKVRDVARDRNGYRVFEHGDIERLRDYANQRIEPSLPLGVGDDERSAAVGEESLSARLRVH